MGYGVVAEVGKSSDFRRVRTLQHLAADDSLFTTLVFGDLTWILWIAFQAFTKTLRTQTALTGWISSQTVIRRTV